MDEKTVREQLDDVRKELKRNQEEHDVLLSLIRGLEGWLRLHSAKPVDAVPQPSLPLTPQDANGSLTKVSMRSALLQVLRDAHGEPLHVKELLQRVMRVGASTNAKSPITVLDLMLESMRQQGKPVEKVASRTWRFSTPVQTLAGTTVITRGDADMDHEIQ